MPRRILQGIVISNKCDQTISVKVDRTITHPLYKKIVKRSKKYSAHDPRNECNIGDIVKIIEHSPISKTKRWILHQE